MKCGLNYRISSCNFVADWTIVMGKMSIVGLALATSFGHRLVWKVKETGPTLSLLSGRTCTLWSYWTKIGKCIM